MPADVLYPFPFFRVTAANNGCSPSLPAAYPGRSGLLVPKSLIATVLAG